MYEILKNFLKNPIKFSQSSMWPIIQNPKYSIYNDKNKGKKHAVSLAPPLCILIERVNVLQLYTFFRFYLTVQLACKFFCGSRAVMWFWFWTLSPCRQQRALGLNVCIHWNWARKACFGRLIFVIFIYVKSAFKETNKQQNHCDKSDGIKYIPQCGRLDFHFYDI